MIPDAGDDGFLSCEDLDLAHCSEAELWAWWSVWFAAAQASNDEDAHIYSHGVFTTDPGFEHLEARRSW